MKTLLSLFFVPLSISISIASSVTGTAQLDNISDHTGIEVRFVPKSLSAVTNFALTLSNGNFSIAVESGLYDVVYSKAGYQTIVVSAVLITSNQTLDSRILSSLPVINVSGTVEGTWNNASVYNVVGDVSIPSSKELIVMPGTMIQFSGFYQLVVSGKLTAEGSKENRILFTSNKTNKLRGDWAGITILTSSDTSRMSYCSIEYGASNVASTALLNIRGNAIAKNNIIRGSAYGGIIVDNNGFLKAINNEITDCYFYGFASGTSAKESIFIGNKVHHIDLIGVSNGGTASLIKSNQVYNTGYTGIQTFGNVLIENNICYNNPYGIFVVGNVTTVRNNTLIWNTHGIGLYDMDFWHPNPDISSNIIAFNSGFGIHCQGNYIPNKVEYNLIFANVSGIANKGPAGLGQIVTTNNSGYPSDTHKNIFLDPEFYSLESTDALFVYLSAGSPAINSGDPAFQDPDLTNLDCGARAYLNADPSSFNLYSPAHQEVIPVNPNTSFHWYPADHPVSVEYELVIYKQDFTKKVNVGTDTTISVNWQNTLKQNKMYSWYVIARSGLSTVHSDTLSFTTPNLAPKPFTLTAPLKDVLISDNDATFQWTSSTDDDVVSYELIIFNEKQEQKFDAAADRTKKISWKTYLNQNTTYSWVVVARDGKSNTFSDTLVFKTPNLSPTVFDLKAPTDNEEIISESPLNFKWSRSLDDVPVLYDLTLVSPTFEITYSSISDTTFTFDWHHLFEPGKTYSWKVKATDGQLVTVTDPASFTLSIILGVNESESFNVWPNPFSQGFTVTSTRSIEKIEVMSVQSSEVMVRRSDANGYFNVEELKPGVYILRIFESGSFIPINRKILKL
jgi:hypothetical protein